MSVLRRLYNVAHGQVLIWRAPVRPDVDLELDRPRPRIEPEESASVQTGPEPVDETPVRPAEPRQRRL